MYDNITVFNIREFLQNSDDDILGEKALQEILSEFSCEKNQDVERFLKEQAVDFAKKNQSVTYLVFSNETMSFLGYFTLAIKPIMVLEKNISKTMAKKLLRVSERNDIDGVFHLSAYLIAQLGKNFSNGLNESMTGSQLLDIAIATIKELQFRAGGMVVFLEAEPNEELLRFYREKNRFKIFDSRMTKGNIGDHELIQLLRIL